MGRSSSDKHERRSRDDERHHHKKSSSNNKKRSREGDGEDDSSRSKKEKKRRTEDDGGDAPRHSSSRKEDHKKRHHHHRRGEEDREKKDHKKKKHHSKHHSGSKRESKKKNSSSSRHKDHPKEKSAPSRLQIDKSKLVPLGDPLGHAPDQLLDPDNDYFAYHKHLWLYLYRDCGTVFNDLTSSQEQRRAFEDFCRLYNAGQLEAAYYDRDNTLPAAALEEIQTTRHAWKFRITDREDKSLQVLQEGVHQQTEYRQQQSGGDGGGGGRGKQQIIMAAPPQPAPRIGHDDHHHRHHHHSKTQEQRQRERIDHRRLREHVRTTHDELTGGPKEGRERQLEQRRARADQIHGAAREREQQGAELDDAALYGGSGDRQVLERSKQHAARRQEQQQARVAELQQKEQEKQAAMLEMLGLSGKIQAGQKIQIAPRKDG